MRADAARLLKEYQLLEIARKYCIKAEPVGAFALDLMVDPDVDIECLVSKLDHEDIISFASELYKTGHFYKIVLYNRFDRGYAIVNIENFEFTSEKWIITFFFNVDGRGLKETLEIKDGLTREARKTVMKIKKERKSANEYDRCSGYEIAKAVLESKAKSWEEVKKGCLSTGF